MKNIFSNQFTAIVEFNVKYLKSFITPAYVLKLPVDSDYIDIETKKITVTNFMVYTPVSIYQQVFFKNCFSLKKKQV